MGITTKTTDRIAALLLFIIAGGFSLYWNTSPLFFAGVGWAMVAYLLLPTWGDLKNMVGFK